MRDWKVELKNFMKLAESLPMANEVLEAQKECDERTEWYPASVKPMREGWYEVQNDGKRYWDGLDWWYDDGTERRKCSPFAFFHWRGLTKHAHQQLLLSMHERAHAAVDALRGPRRDEIAAEIAKEIEKITQYQGMLWDRIAALKGVLRKNRLL